MNNITAEVVPQLANIDIMFKAVIVLFVMGFLAVVGYGLYNLIGGR